MTRVMECVSCGVVVGSRKGSDAMMEWTFAFFAYSVTWWLTVL